MGSPWPWTQQPVKTSSTGSSITAIHNNNNNNKRPNYGYNNSYSSSSSYYNNQHNHDFHQQNNMHNHHHNHRSSSSHTPTNNQHHHHHHPHQQRFPTSSPSPTDSEPMITSEPVMKKPTLPSYFTFEQGMHQHQNQPHHHHTTTNNNYTVRKLNSTASSTTHQSEFVNFVKEIPTWNIYYSDQKHRIIDFSDKNNSIRPDAYINQLVSLCFVDTCITNLAVDAIVNSTTENYCGVDGVDKLIHDQAGRNLREACKSLPRLGPGQAEMTLGFSLPAKYVIHTNGPLTEDADQLTGCYVNSFKLLLMHRLRTIAFPCISTGKKGLSKKFAASIALRTVRHFLEEHKQEVDRVIFCLHHQKDIEIYLRYMQIYFPVVADREVRITIT